MVHSTSNTYRTNLKVGPTCTALVLNPTVSRLGIGVNTIKSLHCKVKICIEQFTHNIVGDI